MTRLAQVSDIHCLLVANTMPTARRTKYNDTTLRQISELREEFGIRVVEALDTWKNWQGRAGGSAELRRHYEFICDEIREQLYRAWWGITSQRSKSAWWGLASQDCLMISLRH